MKVLHIIDSGGLYGAEVMLLNLMQEQARIGIEPILASIGDPAAPEKGIEQAATRLGLRCMKFRFSPGPNFFGAFKVLEFAKQERVDILHSHGYKGNILFGFLPRLVRRLPIVTTVHGWTWTGGMTRMMLYEWLDARCLARMDKVVLVNEAMKNHPRLTNRPGLAVDVIANGIPETIPGDQNALQPEIVDFCKQGYTIGAVGRLSPEKGFDLLVEAVAELVAEGCDLRLILLGEGELRSQLEARIQSVGVGKRVLMPGYVQDAKIYLPLFNLFAMPSHTEGLPIVLLEAMQAAVPIVASRVGGIPNVLQDGTCGLLIESGSREALKLGIRRVLENRNEAEQKVAAARQRVATAYSSTVMAEQYREIYRQAQS